MNINQTIEEAETDLRSRIDAYIAVYIDSNQYSPSSVSLIDFADGLYHFLELDVVDEQRRIASENGRGFTPELDEAMANVHRITRQLMTDFGN